MLTITAAFVPVSISAAAITADPALSGYKTFDLQVTVSSGDDWASGDLKINLASGNFYVPSGNLNTPQKSLFASKPNLQFDTFVSSPNFNTPFLLGHSYLTTSGTDEVFSSTTVDVAWGDLVNNGAGTFTVARLTVSNSANGTLNGRLGDVAKPIDPILFTFNIGSGGGTGGSIAGSVYNDLDGDGVKDSNESGISGRTVYIDADNDSILDAGEKSTTTNASGLYTLSSLSAGTYKVREVIPSGWTQTSPTNNFGQTVTLTTGQTVTGKNFLVKQNTTSAGSISGFVYNDLDGDGVKDSNESGVSGRTVFIDLDNDSALDANEKSATTNASGQYTLSSLGAGSYKVRTIKPSGWVQTFPTNNFGLNVTLSSGQNSTNNNFLTRQSSATNTGKIQGNVFHDFDRDGVKDSGDTGLSGWTVYIDLDNDSVLDSNEVRVLTDSSGNYSLNNLAAGTYKVRIVKAAGYVQTFPTSNFGQNATLSTNSSVATGKNFGADN